jgi:SlyX protein
MSNPRRGRPPGTLQQAPAGFRGGQAADRSGTRPDPRGVQLWSGSMTDQQSLVDRIEALEVRLTYQDETIETLNQTVTTQWKQIDALTRQVAALTERLEQAETSAAPINERPPHY